LALLRQYYAKAAAGLGNKIIVTNTPAVLDDESRRHALGLRSDRCQLPQAERYLRAGQWLAKRRYPLTLR